MNDITTFVKFQNVSTDDLEFISLSSPQQKNNQQRSHSIIKYHDLQVRSLKYRECLYPGMK